MAAASRPKASDKQAILKKLFPLLKKQYKSSVPKFDEPILETLIYAICLENASSAQADAAQERMDEVFHDYNEMRVSSISELTRVFDGMEAPELRALRIRSVLHHVFEENYEFEFEGLRRKTLELATKQLNKIRDLSPFVKSFTLQTALGSHLVPVDETMNRAAQWLGLVEPDATPEDASESLKSVVRKPEGPLFCHLLRNFAHDPAIREVFDPRQFPPPADGYDLNTAGTRLKKLLENGPEKPKAIPAAKKSAKAGDGQKAGQGDNGASAKDKKKTKKSNPASTR